MTDDRERWALILGASSGMGEATSLALAAAGYRIVGVHLDFRAALAHVEEIKAAHRRGRQRGPLHQHERGRRREAGGRDRDDPARDSTRAERPVDIPTSVWSCTRSRSDRSCRSSPTTRRRPSTARRWR